jgi:CHAT domain
VNIAAGVLILIIVAIGFWKALPWWSVGLWIAGVLLAYWFVTWLIDLVRRQIVRLRRLISRRWQSIWNAWDDVPSLAKAVSVGVVGVGIASGGAYLASGSVVYHRLVLAAAPLLVGWTGSEPSYNAVVSPHFDASPADRNDAVVVRVGTHTRLTFGISPRWLANSVLKANPNPEITHSHENVPLTVTLTCNFCAPHPAFIEHMIYQPAKRSSNFVTFDFVPVPPDGAGTSRADARLVLSVVNTPSGMEHDRLTIPILMLRGGQIEEQGQPVMLSGALERPISSKLPAVVDVRLVVFTHQNQGVQIEVQPIREDLVRLLKPYVYDGENPKRFTTGVYDQDQLRKLTTGAYAQLSELTLHGSRASRPGGVPISKHSLVTSILDDAEASDIRDAIALTGRPLYRELFVDKADPSLGKAIELLEGYEDDHRGSAPLRLQIQTDFDLPWQFIHPTGETISAMKFWGMRFNLSVDQTLFEVTGVAGSNGAQPPRKVVFARYALATDPSTPLAEEQIQLLKTFSTVEIVDSNEKMITTLRTQRKSIAAIVAFLHASSSEVIADRPNIPLPPSLLFAPADAMSVDRLAVLLDERTRTAIQAEPRYLGGAPLVILNGCETGPSTRDLPYFTLENLMFKLGAQGVVATEVPVWIPLANEVGHRLLVRLGQGEAASTALLETRRELNDKFNNPLGLLYAYYGNPTSGLNP